MCLVPHMSEIRSIAWSNCGPGQEIRLSPRVRVLNDGYLTCANQLTVFASYWVAPITLSSHNCDLETRMANMQLLGTEKIRYEPS
jgi:hypothetical protein